MPNETPTGKPLLHPLLTAKLSRQHEFKLRREQFVFLSVHPADVAQHEAEGWVVQREGEKKARLKKLKPHDVLLEDRMWCLLHRMGYPDLGGQKFKIRYKRQDGTTCEKQVDIFAKDDETVVVGECKARETRGKRSLQKDLHETESLQKAFADSIRKFYGAGFKPKILWLYVTHNIIWSEPDLERATAINVRVITENEMQYFDSFIRHMGPAGRFQFLAEFFAGQDIPGLEHVKVPATRGTLGKHTFYSFVSTPRHLLKISFVNHLALNHPGGRPAYQRMISSSRIKEIGGFIRNGGYFPTNILVNFTAKCQFDLLPKAENQDPSIKFGWLHLPKTYKSAWVIDGQHRLYGYSNLDDKYWDQIIAVIAFEEMETKDEADLFITINQKQKNVPQSVIVSLQADLKWGSEDPKERLSALCSRLVKTLNADPTGVLSQRFTVEGVAVTEQHSLTMPEVVNGLNKSGLIGKTLNKGVLAPGPFSAVTDEKTIDRSRRILNGYFAKLREANPLRWEAARAGYISTNPGIRAHLLLIGDVIKYLQTKNEVEPQLVADDVLLKYILETVQPVFVYIRDADDASIYERFSRKFGEGGVRDYADNLIEIVRDKISDFGSDDFKARLAKRNDARIMETNQDVIKMGNDIAEYVFSTLKKVYGTGSGKSGEKQYWEVGVESQKTKADAYSKMLGEGSKHPIETYVDMLGIKDIIAQKNNWPSFEAVFSIPMKNEKKGKAAYLGWLAEFNVIRRIPAHPGPTRVYEEEQYAFMKWIKYEFYTRLQKVTGVLESEHDT